ncbi:hypothetical protein WJX74_001659 [Apatococcus lobatus]|uniref:Uncharacterized protein n=1 Tax=Apatococcus lobatus TaxID=904363 RepID=A0AAW1S1Y8_9CHLO
MSSSLTGQVSNAGTALNKRLAAFQKRFSTVLGRHHGYDELSSLEQPLVHDGQPTEVYDRNDSSYFQQHGVDMPGQQNRLGSRVGGPSFPAASAATASNMPDPVQELRECGDLAKEAAEILWEMAAMGDTGDAAAEMLGKSEQLQAQLRGMIGDYSGSDESVMARALEAFETLSNTLEEYHKGTGNPAPVSQQQTSSLMQPARLQPPPGSVNPFTAGTAQQSTAQAKTPVDDEPPLITFD